MATLYHPNASDPGIANGCVDCAIETKTVAVAWLKCGPGTQWPGGINFLNYGQCDRVPVCKIHRDRWNASRAGYIFTSFVEKPVDLKRVLFP